MTEPKASTHRLPFFLMLAVCLLTLGLRIADLTLCTDPATGFVTAGPFWARIAVPAAGVILSYIAASRLNRRPQALLGPCRGMGICMLILTVALGASALLRLLTLSSWFSPLELISAGTALLTALWAMLWGVRAFGPLADPTQGLPGTLTSLPGTLTSLPGTLFFLWLMIDRFAIAPASVMRLGCTIRVLSSAAALLFLAMVLRVFLTPGLPVGHAVFSSGMIAFLLCTCHELPQTVFEFCHGGASPAELAVGIAMGLWGLTGLFCAWYATSEGLPVMPDHMYSQK